MKVIRERKNLKGRKEWISNALTKKEKNRMGDKKGSKKKRRG